MKKIVAKAIIISEITANKDKILQDKINPNVNYNRFDLLYDHYDLYDVGEGVIPVVQKNKTLKCGLYLTNFSDNVLSEFYDFLFRKYSKAHYIEIACSYNSLRLSGKRSPYWHIDLPSSQEGFNTALDRKVLKNTKYYQNKIRKNIGEYSIKKIEPNVEIITLFYEWKRISHDRNFTESPKEFLRKHAITDCYALFVGETILAIRFISDIGNDIMGESMSYDQDEKYKNMGLGIVIYYAAIIDAIKMGKKKFYLCGGNYDHKRHFNGILTYTYSGIISRNIFFKAINSVFCFCRKVSVSIGIFTSRKKLTRRNKLKKMGQRLKIKNGGKLCPK